jgi:hypothetical protein
MCIPAAGGARRGRGRPVTEADAVRALKSNYARAAPAILAEVADWLAMVRRDFDGDYDRFLVLIVIALRTYAGAALERLTPEQAWEASVEAYDGLSTNIASIADSTGVPRETVRRKVGDLIGEGLIAKDGNLLQLTPRASRRYFDVRGRTVLLAARMHGIVRHNT